MKLKKLTALSMTAALAVSALTGCGSAETEENKGNNNESGKTTAAESFADALEKGSSMETYTMDGKLNFSIKADELMSDEYTQAMLGVFGIEGDELKGELTFEEKVKGTDAYQCTIGVEFGNIDSDITELIYVDDTLYVNVKMICDFVETVAEKMDMSSEVKPYLQLIPEGDYVAVTSDMLDQFAKDIMAGAGTSVEGIPDVNEEEAKKAIFYLADEMEKIAKKGENSYSDKDGYTITMNNDNAVSLLKAFVDVFAEDGEEILKNIEVFTGDLGVTADDMKENMGMGSAEDIEALLKEAESVKDSDTKVSVEMNSNYTGAEGEGVFDFEIAATVKDSQMDMGIGFEMKVKEAADLKIAAPESVMAQEDIDALIEMLNGTESYEENSDMDALDSVA